MDVLQMGQLIQARREALGIRQGDLAELAGLTAKSVYLLEHGKGNPSFRTLRRIFEVLGLEWVVRIKTME
jgi:transcriptional regulator with XRE-family HTH domain